ncbi:protein dispatched homolog 1-like [Lytechinus pictus]|uniref:protein dispatched homolog 1-like n=1 Tax=Lytechinus pictus TaxID=7653 RepID=UPI0030B9F6A8
MPRYSRLFNGDDSSLNTGYIDDGAAWESVGAGSLETEDLSYEPTSNGGALRLTTISETDAHERDGEERKSDCGFCHWYAQFLNRFPVLFCLILFALTAGGGAAAFVLYDIPSFSDPLKGFQARQTEINDRTSALGHFHQTRNDSHFYTLPRQSKRSVDGVQGPQADIPPLTTPPNGPSHQGLDQGENDIPSSSPPPTRSPTRMSTQSPGQDSTTYSRFSKSNTLTDGNPPSTDDAVTDTPIDEGSESSFDYSHISPVIPTVCREPAEGAQYKVRLVFSHLDDVDLFSTEALWSMCNLYTTRILMNATDMPQYYQDCEPSSLGSYAALIGGKESCLYILDEDVTELRYLLQECAQFFVSKDLTSDCGGSSCPGVPSNCTIGNVVFNTFQYLLPMNSASHIAEGDFKSVQHALMVTPFPRYSSEGQDVYKNNIMRHDIRDSVTKLSAVGAGFKFDLFSDFLVSNCIYLVIGIGLILLIVWLYTGSLFVTLMTIVDMVMSLIFAYFLYTVVFGLPFFPFMNVLAFVLIIGIGADDAFVYVDIWKKMRERHGGAPEKRVLVLQDTLHHAAVTMFVTSFTTSSALFSSVISSITALRCLAVYAGCAILINFIYTVTWLPAIVVIEDKYLQFRMCRERITPTTCYVKIKEKTKALTGCVRSFWETMLPLVVFKLRYLWIVLFTLLGVGGACCIFVKPKLQLPTKNDFQVFISSDYMEQYDQIYKKDFLFERGEKRVMPILFVWGVVPDDNGNPWDPDDEGFIVFDRSFNLSSKDSQQWLLDFCHDIRNQTFYSKADKASDFCFIEILKSAMETPCNNPALPFSPSPSCCNQTKFPYDPELFDHCAPFWTSSLRQVSGSVRFGEKTKFRVQSSMMTGLQLSFTSTTTDTLVYENISEFWYQIDNWGKEKMKNAPPGMAGGWFGSYSSNQMFFFDLQESLARGTKMSIALSLGMATMVLLFTTRNLLITLFATLSIGGTVFVTIGSLVLLGWELNILESTVMSLAVGLSVDFTIHYGVAYGLAPHKDRASRSTFAMVQLTSAITTAALSTFIAGAVMLPSVVLCYQQIGIFLTLVMTVSWFYANFFFMPLCRALGPEGNCAQIPVPSCSCCCASNQSLSADQRCCCCPNRQGHSLLDVSPAGDIDLGFVADT